jgi:hypothetical protein
MESQMRPRTPMNGRNAGTVLRYWTTDPNPPLANGDRRFQAPSIIGTGVRRRVVPG